MCDWVTTPTEPFFVGGDNKPNARTNIYPKKRLNFTHKKYGFTNLGPRRLIYLLKYCLGYFFYIPLNLQLRKETQKAL